VTRQFKLTLIWLAGGTLALLMALNWLPASQVGDEYVPVGQDSFYHARRILDAVPDPGAFYQFDPKIYAPEGSWVPWPWAYDLGMAWLVRAVMAITGPADPMTVLVYIPPAWTYVNLGILLALGVALGLRPGFLAVAAGCFALLPMNQGLHAAGMLDHHFVELSFVLLSLWTGVRWMQTPHMKRWAVAYGVVVGAATAFHNGLFILQLPFLGTVLLLWLRNIPLPRTAGVFCLTFLGSQLIVLVPSQPFRLGEFSFYLLSWFHLYAASCTALIVLLLYRLRPTWPSLLLLAGVCLALAGPVLPQLLRGGHFVMADLTDFEKLAETKSLVAEVHDGRTYVLCSLYSGLLFLLPGVALWQAYRAFRDTDPGVIFFAVGAVFGGLLLVMQYRFHYYGTFALYLPVLVLLSHKIPNLRWGQRWAARAAVASILIAAYIPAVRQLYSPVLLGHDIDYTLGRNGFIALAPFCEAQPGIVLAQHDDGHFIRYHTDCAVISNNMIITPQHERKVRQSEDLLSLSAGELRAKAPWVDYVLVRWDQSILDPTLHDRTMERHAHDLRGELLFPTAAPPGYDLLYELLATRSDARRMPYLRIFRIHHPDQTS
jgi:asparagine N-glycosylation enzyme membrane subunit Stt3